MVYYTYQPHTYVVWTMEVATPDEVNNGGGISQKKIPLMRSYSGWRFEKTSTKEVATLSQELKIMHC